MGRRDQNMNIKQKCAYTALLIWYQIYKELFLNAFTNYYIGEANYDT